MARTFLKPLQFRFEHPDDVKLYGDDWFVYSEYAIVELPARRLAELEAEMGLSVVAVFNGLRENTAMGDLCSAWLAIRLSSRSSLLPDKFEDFNPYTMQMEWEAAPEGKDSAPAPAPSPSVSLPILPAVESPA